MRRNQRRPLLPLWGFPLLAVFLVLWSAAAAASDLHPIRHAEGRLWRIERGDAPPSHIIGTIHIADPRVRDLPAPIREAFEASEQAAFERRMTPEENAALMATTGIQQRYSLAKLVDREAYESAIALGARYGLPEEAVDQLHPFTLAYIFSFSPEEYLRQASGDLFLDAWLIQWAYDLGMRVEGLETVEEIIGLIEHVSVQDHAAMLLGLLEQLAADPNYYEKLVSDYLAGDMTRIFREMEKALAEDSASRAFKEALLDDRNRKMVERMIPLLERGKTFVAVGAAHLPGDEGMLHLLEQQGYRITRIY